MKQRRLILFSGMAGDSRLFRLIRIPEVEVVTPDHVEPIDGETLPQYASRIADLQNISPTDFVGGASFGGMLAAEISRQRPVAGLVLLGTCLRPTRLPIWYRWAAGLGPFIPDAVFGLRSWRFLIRWRLGPLSAEAEDSLIEMAASSSNAQSRAFGRMIFDWPGVERVPCPVLSIHGDSDRVIPIRCANPDIVLKDAGHAFTLTHAEQTISAIHESMLRVCSYNDTGH